MIESITARNFQKHKNLRIEFGPGVNCLVGPSGAGKSTVLRLLRWVILNKLAGNPKNYVRWGQLSCTGIMKVDGHTVVRKRGKSSNLYKLDGRVFRAFGSGVPDEVAAILNCSPTNFQRQLDPQFWITESAGQIAKNLNQIVNLEQIDRAVSLAAAKVRKARSAAEVSEDRLGAANDRLESLSWVPAADRDLRVVEKLEARLKVLTSRIASAGRTVADGVRLASTRDRAACAMLGAEKAAAAGERWAKTAERVETLAKLVGQIEKAKSHLDQPVPDIGPLIALRKRADELSERRAALDELVEDIERKEKDLCRVQSELSATTSRLHSLPKNRKRCPTCGQPLKNTRSPSSRPISTSG